MKLIDYDVLRRYLLAEKEYADEHGRCFTSDVLSKAIHQIDKMDVVDTVIHGRWMEITTHNGCTPDYDCVCSECGSSGVPYYNYCPYCGAKMDLFNSEDEDGTD